MAPDYEVLEHQLQTANQRLSETRRGLQATEQALLDCQAEAHGAQASGDAARAELATLRLVDERAREARCGGNVHETDDYERGWIAAAEYVFGTSKAGSS